MRFFRFTIKVIINNTVRLLSLFVKKDYNLWLFSDAGGKMFSGNTWYFYDYVKENHKDIKTICFANTKELQQKVLKHNGQVCAVNTFKSFLATLKAGVCIFQWEMASDLVNFSRRGTYKINLWHGGGIKKIYYGSRKMKKLMENKPIKQKILDILIGYIKLEEYDFIAYKSDVFHKIMVEAFNNKKVYLTGNTRDDLFFKKISKEDILEKYKLKEIKDKKIVTYLPTFRDKTKSDIDYFIFNNNTEVLQKLKDNNIVILQKKHPGTLLQYSSVERIQKIQNVYDLSNNIDPQELFYITDIFITDYSGCYFDFLHTLRPIIFYPYDKKEYLSHDRELYFDYNDELVTPGHKVYNEDELYLSIEKYLNNPKLDLEKRKKSLKYFQKYSDGQASKRVYESIIEILNKE